MVTTTQAAGQGSATDAVHLGNPAMHVVLQLVRMVVASPKPGRESQVPAVQYEPSPAHSSCMDATQRLHPRTSGSDMSAPNTSNWGSGVVTCARSAIQRTQTTTTSIAKI